MAIALLVQNWDAIAPWLVEALFADEVYRRAFVAVAQAGGDLVQAIELADPEARDVLERAAVVDVGVESTDDVEAEARNLISAAVRRELANVGGHRRPRSDTVGRRGAGADGEAAQRANKASRPRAGC